MFSFYSSARKVGAILGPGLGLLSIFLGDPRYISEAAATWQWNNFLEGQAAPGQVVVHINLDETCRCGLFSGGIAVCAYAQVDELRQIPFELRGRGSEKTDQKGAL